MDIQNILGQDVLPSEIVAALQEAFDKKVQEARELAESTAREELAQRYVHDKDQLIEAMDHAISNVVQTYETQKADEITKLREAQEKFHSSLKEAKANYKSKLKEHLSNANSFVAENLANEIKTLREEKARLAEARVAAAEEVESLKAKLSEAHNQHVTKIDEFVVNQLTRELNEFDQDKRDLAQTRAQLIAESRKALQETQKRFVREAATKIDRVFSEQLVHEVKQLHEDIEQYRQQDFGRKIFESFAAEYMASHLVEGTEIKKFQQTLESVQQELTSTKKNLAEAKAISEAAARKVKVAEDRAERVQIMSELLSNLRGEKRAVMEGMLATINNGELRKSFERFLPMVTENVTARKTAQPSKTFVSESEAKPARMVTGNHRNNPMVESAAATKSNDQDEIENFVRLAGIQKN